MKGPGVDTDLNLKGGIRDTESNPRPRDYSPVGRKLWLETSSTWSTGVHGRDRS